MKETSNIDLQDIYENMALMAMSATFQHSNIAILTVLEATNIIIRHDLNFNSGSSRIDPQTLVSVCCLDTYTVIQLIPGKIIRLSFEQYLYDLYLSETGSKLYEKCAKLLAEESNLNYKLEQEFQTSSS